MNQAEHDTIRRQVATHNEHKLTYRINTVKNKLEVSRSTVYRLADRQELKMVKISEKVSAITADSLEQYLRRIGAYVRGEPTKEATQDDH